MPEATDSRAWAESAEEDLILALSSFRRKQPLISGACFHAQQCAEKYMKALLISKNAEFPRTHDLLLLNNLCTTHGILLEINPRDLNTLSEYAVRTRYPGAGPSLEDAREAIIITKLIRKLARKFLGLPK